MFLFSTYTQRIYVKIDRMTNPNEHIRSKKELCCLETQLCLIWTLLFLKEENQHDPVFMSYV